MQYSKCHLSTHLNSYDLEEWLVGIVTIYCITYLGIKFVPILLKWNFSVLIWNQTKFWYIPSDSPWFLTYHIRISVADFKVWTVIMGCYCIFNGTSNDLLSTHLKSYDLEGWLVGIVTFHCITYLKINFVPILLKWNFSVLFWNHTKF